MSAATRSSAPTASSSSSQSNPRRPRNAGGNNAPRASSYSSSEALWTRFFDKHMRLSPSSVNEQQQPTTARRPPSSAFRGGKASSRPTASDHPPSDPLSGSAAPSPQGPRKAKSSRDLASAASRSQHGYSQTRSVKHSITTEADWDEMLKRLRTLVLREGVPGDDFRLPNTTSSARALIWKLLLNVRSIDPAFYLSLVARGPSPMNDKIRNDSFRTLATDQSFKDRVNEEALTRMLNAFVWRYNDEQTADSESPNSMSFSYVQGMNVLAAPFLYVMPSEVEAFHCFCNFIEYGCPTYVQPTLVGVHRGLQLLERSLQIADPALSSHLRATKLNAELYAFPSVLTLCACTPPLRQVLQVWDYLLAFGVHLAIPCIVAQLLLIRDELIASAHPMKLLRQFPALDARSVIGIATTFVRDLDDQLYNELVRHVVEL